MKLKEIFIYLAFLLLILFNPVFSQGFTDTNDILGAIFVFGLILAFVLILLWIGGVIKPGGGKVPWFLVLFIIILLVLFVVPQFVPYPSYLEVPESLKLHPLPSYVVQVLTMIGLPPEWMYLPAIIYLFILPFAGIYTIVWAFLTTIKIFEGVPSGVNRILAFIITFLTIPVGWFVKIVWVVFSFSGIWSVVVFAATFILSVFFRGYGFVEKEKYEAMGRRWRAEARRRLENALSEIRNRQAQGAVNELNVAKSFAGFHNDYYSQIDTAINNLTQTPPNWEVAINAVKKALSYL